jgi:hypothetical protein
MRNAQCESGVARLSVWAVLSLVSPTMAYADGSISLSSIQPTRYYVYEPRPDITAPELAEVFKILLPALTCHNALGNGCDPTAEIEAAPENVKRHFFAK